VACAILALWEHGNQKNRHKYLLHLYEAKGITDRLPGQDIIGIVPEHVIPVYCEQWFPEMKILYLMPFLVK